MKRAVKARRDGLKLGSPLAATADTALTEATVVAYVLGLGDKTPLSPSPPHTVTEITDGNLNYAWAVRDGSGGGVFVKQAPPFIKCLGADYGLPAERMLLESAALDLYGRVAPGTVPRHLHLDPQRCVMVLELLDGYELMRTALRAGPPTPSTPPRSASSWASRTRRRTATACPPPSARRSSRTSRTRRCAGSRPTTSSRSRSTPPTRPTSARPPSPKLAATLRADGDLRRGVAELREVFLSEKECLIHGDLHTGSVMVPAAGSSGAAKVIDGEFAFYGPAAFDVGTFVANIAFALVSVGDDADARKRGLQMIDMATQTYADEMGMTKSDDQAIFNERVAGFAGCELIRRVIGAAHVDDLELMPPGTQRDAAERAALNLGMQLVKTRSMLEIAWSESQR